MHPDRTQSSFERDVLHHRRLDRVSGRQRQHPVRKRLALGDSVANTATTPMRSANGISRRRTRSRRRDRTTAGRWAGASNASTVFSAATPTSIIRSWCTTTTRWRRRRRPEEGYHLTEDLVDKAISFIADSKQVAPNKPFFMYFCPGATHAPHHVPKEWADKYKGQFDDGWDAYREENFRAAEGTGHRSGRRRTLAPRSRRAGLGPALCR